MNNFWNVSLYAFHTALIAFNLFGWIWKSTRRWQLITLLLTIIGWLLLGMFYGVGYCVLTDIHWAIRAKMGIANDPPSFVSLLIRDTVGITPSDGFVSILVITLTSIALVMSVWLNIRDLKRSKSNF